MHEYELYHHGIKGQKWGVRRFQNYDGTRKRVTNSAAASYPKTLYSPPLKNRNKPRVERLDNYKGKLYFVSTEELDGKTLKPRIPSNYFTQNGFEDITNPRICFAPSVDQCLMGISQNLDGKQYCVYEPVKKPSALYKPNAGAVPDSKLTDEMWCVEPTKIKKIGSITVQDDGKPGQTFEYGIDNTAELYSWNYEYNNR